MMTTKSAVGCRAGGIGQALAPLARGVGLRVIATRRSVTAREEDSQGCDVLLPASGLDELLRESDYVVQAVQWTPETDKMLGKAQFEVNSPARAAPLGPSTAVAAAAISPAPHQHPSPL